MKNLSLIILFWFSGIIAGAQFSKFALITPVLQNTYGLDLVYSNFLISSLGILGIIFGASIGIIAGRFSPKRLVVISLILAGIISLAQTVIPFNSLFLLIRILEGMTQLILVTATPTAMLLVADKKYKSHTMALWGTFFSIAFTVSNMIGPMMISRWGWQSFFYLHATAAIFIGTILYFISSPVFSTVQQAEKQHRSIIKQHVDIYAEHESSLPGILFGLHTLFFMLLLVFLPQFFSYRFPENANLSAIMLTLLPLVSLAGTFLSGIFTKAFKGSPIISIMSVFAGQALLISANCFFNTGIAVLFASSLLMLVNSGLIQGLIFVIIPYLSDNPKHHAHANGAVSQMGNLGATLGIPLFTMLMVNFSWKAAFAFPVICCLAGLVTAGKGLRLHRQTSQGEMI